MKQVTSDLRVEMKRASGRLQALLIVPDDADIKLLADELGVQLQRASKGTGNALPTLTVVSRRTLKTDKVPHRRNLVALSPRAVADEIDLGEFGYVGVLTVLPERLSTKLIFTPPRRVEGGQFRVFDYVGQLAKVAKGHAKNL